MTIEEMLAKIAAKGDLTHLTLFTRGDGKFECDVAGSVRPNGYTHAEAKDPVTAVEEALKAHLAPVKRAKKPAGEDDLI